MAIIWRCSRPSAIRDGMVGRITSSLRRVALKLISRIAPGPQLRDGAKAGPTLVRTRSSASRGVCLITMARNETVFLTHWIWHYSNALDQPRFILLDDASDPSMVETLRARFPDVDLEVIRLPEGPFSDQYKSNALSALALLAVERFAVVIATDADEIVMPIGAALGRPLFDVLLEAPAPFAAPVGVAPIQDTSREPAFDPMRSVAEQRRFGQLRSASCKPCVWKGEAWLFSPGQHALWQRRVPITDQLALVHLKYVDADLLGVRQRVRQSRDFSVDQDDSVGRHWRQPPASLARLPLFDEARTLRDAPRLTDAIPGYLENGFDRWNGHYVIRDLRQVAPVLIEGEL